MAKALITGGLGFIGLHLARTLAEAGCRVDLVDNLSRGAWDDFAQQLLAGPDIRFFQRDLLHAESLPGFDTDYHYIYHLSAILGVQNVLRDPLTVLRDNVSMVFHVLDLARRQTQLRRFVFFSTSEVYAGTLQHFGLTFPTPETTPLALTSLESQRTSYMLSKIYGEALCQQAGLPFTIVRPHNIYGPRMGLAHVIPELLQKAHVSADGQAVDVFSVDHRRTFCFISDAVELIRRAAENPECLSETLNVGTQGPEVSIEELARLIFKVVGKELTIRPQAATPGSPTRRCPDMTKTQSLTGFTPMVNLTDGVGRTYDWYRLNAFSPKFLR
jgi:nucleoside-diphosphate-sugar epimerase